MCRESSATAGTGGAGVSAPGGLRAHPHLSAQAGYRLPRFFGDGER